MRSAPGILTALCLLCSLLTADAADPRYRSYGRVPSVPIAFREGAVQASVARSGADFVTLGKLDGNDLGPFADVTLDYVRMATRLLFLYDWQHQVPTGRFNPLAWLYGKLLAYTGAQRTPSKQVGLCQLIAAEDARVNEVLQLFAASQHNEYVIEIGNEPNLFPYLSPELYAWFYDRMHHLVYARAARLGVATRVRVMPAGLWNTQGLPRSVLTLIERVLGPDAADVERYYRRFLIALGRMRGGNQASSACERAPVMARMPDNEALAVASRLIDLGNQHFYPWVHETSSFHDRAPTMAQKHALHASVFGAFMRFVAAHSRTRAVWLTETGNINPIAVADMTRDFVAPLCDGLESLSGAGGPVSRWYWFKARGEDPKFGLLNKLGNYVDALARIPRSLAAFARPVKDLRELAVALAALRRHVPPQGLVGDDHVPRPFGTYYLQRAKVAAH